MTTVGHSLFAASLAAVGLPKEASRWNTFWQAHLIVLAANIPDLPFRGWGHDRYDISHSLFVTVILSILFAALAWQASLAGRRLHHRVIALFALSWLSHLFLDMLYAHGHGIAIFWPVSQAHVALPIPWFETLRLDRPFSAHNLEVFAIEAAFYGVLFLLALFARFRLHSRRARHRA